MRARTWSTRMACGCMCMWWAECLWAMAWLWCRTCCQCHVCFQESMFSLVFLIQDLSTCPHCPISRLNGEHCDFGMYDGGSYMVDRTGIRMAMASRSQPHFWSQLRSATNPGGKVPPGQDCHSLLELRADMTLVSPMHSVFCGDGGGSCCWLVLGSLSPLPWQVDVRCPAHLACLAHQ